MRKVTLTKESTRDILGNLLKRSPNNYGKFESAVAEILAKVKSEGDEALFAYTKQFDKVEINKGTIRVTEEEIKEAYDTIDPALLDVIRKALVNIRTYHEKQIQNSWFTSTTNGTMLGQKVTPLNQRRCLCSRRKGSLSFLCTYEYCACQGCRSTPYCNDHPSGKGRQSMCFHTGSSKRGRSR